MPPLSLANKSSSPAGIGTSPYFVAVCKMLLVSKVVWPSLYATLLRGTPWAVHVLQKTGNLRMVQKQLGHASPVTTANMYANVSFENMKSGVEDLYNENASN